MSEENKSVEETVVDNAEANHSEMSDSEVSTESATYIAESKKYRKRAQEAELWKADRLKQDKIAEEKRLAQIGEHKTIIANKDKEIEELKPFKDRFLKWEQEEKERIMNQIPEQERSKFDHLQVEDLRNIVKLNPVHNVQVDESRASARDTSVKPFSAKSKDKAEQKKTWKDRINSYR